MILDPYVGDSIQPIQKETVSSLQPGNWSDVVRPDGGLDKEMLPRVYEAMVALRELKATDFKMDRVFFKDPIWPYWVFPQRILEEVYPIRWNKRNHIVITMKGSPREGCGPKWSGKEVVIVNCAVEREDPQASGTWGLKGQTFPKGKVPSLTISIDYSNSQMPFSTPSFYPDSDYPMGSYVN